MQLARVMVVELDHSRFLLAYAFRSFPWVSYLPRSKFTVNWSLNSLEVYMGGWPAKAAIYFGKA